MTKVVGVRFKTGSRIYYFDPLEFTFAPNDGVIVETARGLEFGIASGEVMDVPESEIVQPLKPVIRKASDEDWRMRQEYAARESEAFQVCEKKILDHKLDMKLVDVEYTFNGSKVVFYFTADERVDFRELVKDLASHFRTRIELRQIGVRDEAKMLGGLGPCGRPVCCKTFLDDFKPVSIKMAKEQNLSLSPTKISGLCGRLMCCLQYEQSTYEETKKKMPKTGKEVMTPDGIGIAVENNAITEKTKVRLTLPDGTLSLREYHYSNLCKPGEQPAVPAEPEIPVKKAEPLPQSVAYVAPDLPENPKEQDPEKKRRRRRGGRGKGQPVQGEEHRQEKNAQNQPKERKERREGDRPRPERSAKPRSEKPKGEQGQKQPRENPQQNPQQKSGEGTSRPRHRNRRRPGGPKPAPKGEA